MLFLGVFDTVASQTNDFGNAIFWHQQVNLLYILIFDFDNKFQTHKRCAVKFRNLELYKYSVTNAIKQMFVSCLLCLYVLQMENNVVSFTVVSDSNRYSSTRN